MSRPAFALVALGTFLALFSLANAAYAQQPSPARRVGVLVVGFSPESKDAQQFRQGSADLVYAEGRQRTIGTADRTRTMLAG